MKRNVLFSLSLLAIITLSSASAFANDAVFGGSGADLSKGIALGAPPFPEAGKNGSKKGDLGIRSILLPNRSLLLPLLTQINPLHGLDLSPLCNPFTI